MKRTNTRKWFAVLIIIGLLSGLGLWQNKERIERRWLYPWPFAEIVLYHAGRNNLDPYLVAGLINNESRFRAAATSERGAVGLMQLMPETAAWAAQEMGVGRLGEGALLNPDTNVRLGCWYLSELLHEFNGNEVLALAAYNAGRGTVHQWMKAHDWDTSFQDVQAIPYQETRAYVRRVLDDRGKYQSLYLAASRGSGNERRKS